MKLYPQYTSVLYAVLLCLFLLTFAKRDKFFVWHVKSR